MGLVAFTVFLVGTLGAVYYFWDTIESMITTPIKVGVLIVMTVSALLTFKNKQLLESYFSSNSIKLGSKTTDDKAIIPQSERDKAAIIKQDHINLQKGSCGFKGCEELVGIRDKYINISYDNKSKLKKNRKMEDFRIVCENCFLKEMLDRKSG